MEQIALNFIPGIGCVTARALIEGFGTAEEVFAAKKSKLLTIQGVGERTAGLIARKQCFARAEKEVEFIDRHMITPLFFTEDRFPARLRNCYDAPAMLYYKGPAALNAKKVVSIVGTRNATPYGRELVKHLVADLHEKGILVVSGLAHGVDGLAHRACVKNGVSTIGVLGHGLDRVYPLQHRDLAERMLENGGLLTEFPSGTKPDRENFPKRNRIIAGMADATIVVEAGVKGGALITADLANSYNRDVFAFPGDVFSEYSAGCNFLIKTNRAHLVSRFRDIEYLLGWTDHSPAKPKQTALLLNFTEEERLVTDILQADGATSIDDLCFKAQTPQSKMVVVLLGLEMQGIVVSMPGKLFRMA
nr:DNA-processing protein DprA [Hufsiella ginkgonis]